MKQEIKKIFPNIPNAICDIIENCFFLLKTKAKMQYNFSFNGIIQDLPYDEKIVVLKTNNKKRDCNFIVDLNKVKSGMMDLNIDEKYHESSVFGSLLNIICKEYTSSLLIMDHYDELFKDINNNDVIKLSLELANLQFSSTILCLPLDQVTEKVDICLRVLWDTNYFKDSEEMKNYALNLSRFMESIIENHFDFHNFFITQLENLSKIKKDIIVEEPTNLSNSYETSDAGGRK
jgi:hypothetical protein